eukprot:3429216-Prymnesium_polylepis.1
MLTANSYGAENPNTQQYFTLNAISHPTCFHTHCDFTATAIHRLCDFTDSAISHTLRLHTDSAISHTRRFHTHCEFTATAISHTL